MKKVIALGGLLLLASGQVVTDACTNILVTRGASKTGSTMVSYSADSHTLYGELYFRPAADYAPGAMMTVREWDTGRILGQIPQVAHTYSVVGNMNEHQLLIGESTWGGLPQLVDTTGIMDYGSLIYTALQRAKTARQAIGVMTDLVEKYGYASSGESFSIADGTEVWILELVGKGTRLVAGKGADKGRMVNADRGAVWVAIRIPDGMVSAHANQARITRIPFGDKENCLYSKDVVSFARKAGLYTGSDADFDFSATYNPLEFSAMRGCEGRVWSVFRQITDGMEKYEDHILGQNPANRLPLYVKPNDKLTVKEVAEFMRNHYENSVLTMTEDPGAGPFKLPYRWRPMTWKVDSVEYYNERAIATQQTGWWYVGESRRWLPDAIGGVYWFGVDDADSSPLTPIYCSSTAVPPAYAVGNGNMTTYSPTAMFWLVNRVTNFAYTRYSHIHPDVERALYRWEDARFAQQASIDAEAWKLYEQDPARAVEFLTDYSVGTAQELFELWSELDRYLLVKYIDGNTKKETAKGQFTDNGFGAGIPQMPDFPGYNDEWKRIVAGATGDHLKVVEVKK